VAFSENADELGLNYAIYSFLNGFSDSERGGVKLTLETYDYQLRSEFNPIPKPKLQPDEVVSPATNDEFIRGLAELLKESQEDDVTEAQI
jgi:hypothetical protein